MATQVTLLDMSEPASPSAAQQPQSQPAASVATTASTATVTAPSSMKVAATPLVPGVGAAVPTASTGAALSPASGAAAAVDFAALGSDYRRRLLEHIAAHRRPLPPGAPLGLVYVNFSLARSGEVQSVAIAVSSGDAALDRAALDSIQSANPMPAIPPAFPNRLTVMVPVDFRRLDQVKLVSRP